MKYNESYRQPFHNFKQFQPVHYHFFCTTTVNCQGVKLKTDPVIIVNAPYHFISFQIDLLQFLQQSNKSTQKFSCKQTQYKIITVIQTRLPIDQKTQMPLNRPCVGHCRLRSTRFTKKVSPRTNHPSQTLCIRVS